MARPWHAHTAATSHHGSDLHGAAGCHARALRSYLPCAAARQVRTYVLEVSIDQAVEQSLGTRTCEHCGADTYEARLGCAGCGARWDACVVSGYPVVQGERVVPRPGALARREDWNTWVGHFQTDPLTGAPAAPLY